MSRRAVPHACHWGAFSALVEDGRLVGVEPFAKDPEPPASLHAWLEGAYAPNRVRRPAVRRGWLENGPHAGGRAGARRGDDPFVAVSWDRALDLVAEALRGTIARYGNAGIFGGSYGWSSAGRFHHAKTQLQRFLNLIGGFTDQSENYSVAAGLVLLPRILGSVQAISGPTTGWDAVAADGELVIAFGGLARKNLEVAPGGPGVHEVPGLIRRAHAAGVKFVSISPNRADCMPELEAEWVPIRPNSDTAMMLAMAQVLLEEGLADLGFCETHCVGLDTFARYLDGTADGVRKSPGWAEAITGVPAAKIRDLARRAAGQRTLLTTAWALQRAENGEQSFWASVALAALIGDIGLPGGGLAFGLGSMGGMGAPRHPVVSPALSKGRNPAGSSIPVARIADCLLHPGERYRFNGETRRYPEIGTVYWCGGNPFHHHQDLNRLVRAFQRPETIVVQEIWWTPTARLADIVLPATTTLERNDIGASGRDRFILAMKQAIAPQGEARNDHDILRGLAARFGREAEFTEGLDEMAWLRRLYDEARAKTAARGLSLPDFDAFWAAGHAEQPAPAAPYNLLAAFRADPAADPLATPSGRIEIASETIAGFGDADLAGHAQWREPLEWLGAPRAKTYPLHLISNQPAPRLHSQMSFAVPSAAERRRGLEPLGMNPADAERRGIAEGDAVRIFNDRGETRASARLTDDLARGVVLLPTGGWYAPRDWGLPGSPDRGGNPNVLTRDTGTSSLGQGPSAMSALVEVERLAGPSAGPLDAADPFALPEILDPTR